MSTRDIIAAATHAHLDNCDCGTPSLYHYEIADAVIAAVRAMPVEGQAELIGGEVAYREPRSSGGGEYVTLEVRR